MNRIIINETDITTNELPNISSDIVYVPGFSVFGAQEARKPKLCTSISDFETAFGRNVPQFMNDQLYPINDGTNAGFDSAAIPTVPGANGGGIWFAAKTFDPSYIYAKQLIRSGLSVVYERINTVDPPAFALNNDNEIASPVNVYSATAIYNAGDYVIYNDSYYQCTTTIATPEAWTAAHWARIDREGNTYPTYDSTATYAEGSHVTYSTKYYVCIEAITTAEDWTAAHWSEVSSDAFDYQVYDVTVKRMYDAMMGSNLHEGENGVYERDIPGSLSEVSTYNIKYITSGGYPTFEYSSTSGTSPVLLAQKLADLATSRGDCIAFIDHTDSPTRPLTGEGSVYAAIEDSSYLAKDTASFSTMVTPWAVYDTVETSNISLPGSFSYFMALSRALKTYPSWLPIAGVVRGLVPSLKYLNTSQMLTNAIADSYQQLPTSTDEKSSINAITYINDQGYTVWGNRTFSTPKNGFATLFLNMRNLICDVKKQAFKSAQRYMFEQNTDILWVNFKNDIQKLLDQMVTSSVINRYKILRLTSQDKTRIMAKIQIVPIYAVEAFEISIIMTDEEITVE